MSVVPIQKAQPRTILSAEAELLAEIRTKVAEPVLYDLGCGQRPHEGYIGLDLFSSGEHIRKADLFREPWMVSQTVTAFDVDLGHEREVTAHVRIPDESVDMLHSSHFVEHVPDWNLHFREAYRVLKPRGYYIVKAPYFLNTRYFQDPDHKQMISEARFEYLNWDWLVQERIEHGRERVNFTILRDEIFYALHGDFQNAGLNDEAMAYARTHYFNVVDDIAVILRKEPIPNA